MPAEIPQPSPTDVLNAIVHHGKGHFSVECPQALCFGSVINGGFVASLMHHVAVEFVLENSKTAAHHDVWQAGVTFFRPTFSAPKTTLMDVRVASANKKWTTLHVEVSQGDSVCAAGYLTLTDLSVTGLSVSTGWKMSPPVTYPVASFEDLENDRDQNWIGYHAPLDHTSIRYVQSYFKCFQPSQRLARNMCDQWITTGWTAGDGESNGAVWTNELLHLLVDNCMPLFQDLVAKEEGQDSNFYENVIGAALYQRQARSEGKLPRPRGPNMGDGDLNGRLSSTITISTQFHKALPAEGAKWLFMRVTTKTIMNGRIDYEIVVLDRDGDCVAVSQHTMTDVPISQKQARQKSVL